MLGLWATRPEVAGWPEPRDHSSSAHAFRLGEDPGLRLCPEGASSVSRGGALKSPARALGR